MRRFPLKLIFLFLFLVLIFSLGSEKVLSLEIKYPGFNPSGIPTIPEYVRYLVNFIIGISGIVLFGIIIYAGFLWLVSAGNPSLISEAKRKILYGCLGIALLLLCWVFFNTIFGQIPTTLPELKKIFVPLPSGIWACKQGSVDSSLIDSYLNSSDPEVRNESKKRLSEILSDKSKCIYLTTGNFEIDASNFQFVYLPSISGNEKKYELGLIAYSEKDQRGKCMLVFQSGNMIYTPSAVSGSVSIPFKVQSVKVFQKPSYQFTGADIGVTLLDCFNFGINRDKDCVLLHLAKEEEKSQFPHHKTFMPTGDFIKVERNQMEVSGSLEYLGYDGTFPLWKHAYSLKFDPENLPLTVLLINDEDKCLTLTGPSGNIADPSILVERDNPIITRLKSMIIIKGQ